MGGKIKINNNKDQLQKVNVDNSSSSSIISPSPKLETKTNNSNGNNKPKLNNVDNNNNTTLKNFKSKNGFFQGNLFSIGCLFVSMIFLLFIAFILVIGLIGQWSENEHALQGFSLYVRGKMLQVNEENRDELWKMKEFIIGLFFDFLGFLIGFKGERADYFETSKIISEDLPAAFREGFMIFDYQGVKTVLTSPNQDKGFYFGALPVSEHCFGNDTLLFRSTGKEHSMIRKLLFENIPSFTSTKPLDKAELGDDAGVNFNQLPIKEFTDLVQRTLIRTLYKTLIGETISKSILDDLVEYSTIGGTCVFGATFQKLTRNIIAEKILRIRLNIRQAILKTTLGQNLKVAGKKAVADGLLDSKAGEDYQNGEFLVRQLADGLAFAGVLGTFHLTISSLRRIYSDPMNYVPLFLHDPLAFLHEEARVDPPVTSATFVLHKAQTILLGPRVGNVTFKSKCPYQLVFSTANVDPSIFGGKYHSRNEAYSFNPNRENLNKMVSWNGILEDVQKLASPRGCPGYNPSMVIARAVVQHFLPALDTLPIPMDPTGHGSRHKLRLKQHTGGGGGNSSNQALIRVAEFDHQNKAAKSSFFNKPYLFDDIGFFIWGSTCLISIGWIIGKKPTSSTLSEMTISLRFIGYLVGQVIVSCAFILHYDYLYLHGQLWSAIAYGLIFVTIHYQDNAKRGLYYSFLIYMAALAVALMLAVFQFSETSPLWINYAVAVFYGSMATLALKCLFKFYMDLKSRGVGENESSKEHSKRLSRSRIALFGGIFGLLDLFAAFIHPLFGTLISRALDSFLYLPLAVPAVVDMDGVYLRMNMLFMEMSKFKVCRRICSLLFWSTIILLGFGYFFLTKGDICAFEDKARLAAMFNGKDYSSLCTGTPLTKVDIYGRLLFSITKIHVSSVSAHSEEYIDPKCIDVPKPELILPKLEVVPKTGFVIPAFDSDEDSTSLAKQYVVAHIKNGFFDKVLGNPVLFPIHDNPERWENLKSARIALKLAGGQYLPLPVTSWDGIDVTSDTAIEMMVFAGFCGTRLQRLQQHTNSTTKPIEKWKVDFSEMYGLEVRPGYERFGVIAYFGPDQKLTRIRWLHASKDVYPGNVSWNHAKWVFRCSALTGLTAIEHLVNVHLITSNVASTFFREHVPKDHPIRRFLKPFTHNSIDINLAVKLFLTSEYSLLHRTVSLTYKGLRDAFIFALNSFKLVDNPMKVFEQDVKELGENFPFAQDGIDFFQVIHHFVSQYVGIYYPNEEIYKKDKDLEKLSKMLHIYREDSSKTTTFENSTRDRMINVISTFIFYVTGYHHVIGNVAEYLMYPNFASARIRPNSEVSDVEASHYGLLIAILTGASNPKLNSNFEHLLLQDDHLSKTTKIFREFQSNLTKFGLEVDKRNNKRKWKFNGFHPDRLLCSVSI